MTIFSGRTTDGGTADLEITVSKESGVKATIHIPTYAAPNATHKDVPFNSHMDEFLAALLANHGITFLNMMMSSQITHIVDAETELHRIGF